MGAAAIQAMTDRVAQLMEEKLGLRGRGLEAKLTRGGRLLPKPVRSAALSLSAAAAMVQNPKLAIQVNDRQVAADYDICLRHLTALPASAGWGGHALASLRAIAFGLLTVAVLLIGYLVWRGYV